MTETIFLIALVPLLLFGIGDAIAAIPGRRLSPITMTFIMDVTSFILFGVLAFFFWQVYVFDSQLIFALLAGVAGYTGFLMYVYSLRLGSVGVTAAIANSYPLLTLAYGYVLLHELITPTQLIAVALILIGLFGISTQFSLDVFKRDKIRNTSIVLAFGAALMWALHVVLSSIALVSLEAIQVIHFSAIGSFVFGAIVFFVRRSRLTELCQASKNVVGFSMLTSLVYFTGMFVLYLALKLGSVGIVSTVAAASPFVSAVFAYVFFKERLPAREWIAVAFVVIGLISLGLSV